MLEKVGLDALGREAAVELVHLYIKERRHTLSVSIPKEPLRVLGDKARLIQALSALISHTANSMPAGGHLAEFWMKTTEIFY